MWRDLMHIDENKKREVGDKLKGYDYDAGKVSK